MKKIILALAIFASFQAFSQVPSNDICTNAIELIPNAGLVASTNLNTVTEGTSPSCGVGAGAAIKDVWYKFTFTGGTFTLTTTLGTLADTRTRTRGALTYETVGAAPRWTREQWRSATKASARRPSTRCKRKAKQSSGLI